MPLNGGISKTRLEFSLCCLAIFCPLPLRSATPTSERCQVKTINHGIHCNPRGSSVERTLDFPLRVF